jgi:hypothetical protein
MNSDGTDQTNLTNDPTVNEWCPYWQPLVAPGVTIPVPVPNDSVHDRGATPASAVSPASPAVARRSSPAFTG